MSFMFEIYYASPPDDERENAALKIASRYGGECTDREEGGGTEGNSICLTIEFADMKSATAAAKAVEASGEYVEGPQDYGDG